MKLEKLRVNHVEAPLGFQVNPLSFSWVVTECGEAKKQKWAHIRVHEFWTGALVFDSGEDPSADSLDYQVNVNLKPRTEYTWDVTVMADNGERAFAVSGFETGKMEEVWVGQWISPVGKKRADEEQQKEKRDPEGGLHEGEMEKARERSSVILCKRFCVEKSEAARLYMCGLGVYECQINGQKVGEEYLAPGYHSYDFHLQTQTYDVTSYLKAGENEIAIWLGEGWFKGRLGFDGGFTDIYGDRLYAIAELYVKDENGERLAVATDDTWESRLSPVRFNNIYDGEVYDARLETICGVGTTGNIPKTAKGPASLPATQVYGADLKEQDSNNQTMNVWIADGLYQEPGAVTGGVELAVPKHCGPLTDRYSLPIVKKESFAVRELIHTPKDEIVLDFGQEITGWVEIACDFPEGTKITLTAGEILQNQCFYRENLRTAKAEFTYISNGKKALARPHFTFYGFRYMKVECDAPVTAELFTAWHLRSDFDQIGWIETANAKVNQLFSNALWGQKDNFLDVPTDCPQRDERLGWTGDAQVFSETACYNMYMPAFYRKFLWDMRAEQSILGGSVPNVVPRLKQGMVAEHGSCPWADAGVIIPWNVYQHYGSKTLLAEMYPGMKAWVDAQRKREEAIEGSHLIKDGFHFADWLALDNPEPGPFGATDPLYIASAYYYRCADIVAKAADDLGYEEADDYHALAEDIRTAIRETYFDEDGICACKTQTGAAIAICFGLTDPTFAGETACDTGISCDGKPQSSADFGLAAVSDAMRAEGEALEMRVKENNDHLNTGFVGTPLLCPALTKTGHHDTAVTLLLNEDFPSWLYSVNLGATTIWERWDSVGPDGTISAEGMNSLNHYSYGSIEAWMYGYVCGIRPAGPGFRETVLEPHPDPRLGYVKGKLETAAGVYESSWKYDACGNVTYSFTVPFGAKAALRLPDGREEELTAGRYCR